MNIQTNIITFIIGTLFLLTSLGAEGLKHKEHKHIQYAKKVQSNHFILKKLKHKNQLFIEIYGLVCSFCGSAIEKKIERFDFLDKKKLGGDGIELDIKKGIVEIATKKNIYADSKKIPFTKLVKSIESGGYEPKKFWFKQGTSIGFILADDIKKNKTIFYIYEKK